MTDTAADKIKRALPLIFVILWPCRISPSHFEANLSLPIEASSREGCTIGVVSARVTADHRPLLWKVRDNSELPNNSVTYDTSFPYHFIAVTNSGDAEVWMGVNNKGFAIMNSTALDLPAGTEGLNNGLLMQYALGTCPTIAEFRRLLDSTNSCGRRTQGNFGVIDANGDAMMFEVGGMEYWTFDANDSTSTPEQFVIRTNFSMTAGGNTGIERYRRAIAQIRAFALGDTLDHRRILRYHARDLSDNFSNPVLVPFRHEWTPAGPIGYINSNVSISRHKTVSAMVAVGVRPGELPPMSTMWTILGQPATGIAVPYWPIGNPPDAARGFVSSPLNDIANQIRSLLFDFPANRDYLDTYKLRDECGNGLWAVTFPVEDSVLNTTDALLERWRVGMPPMVLMLWAESTFAYSALSHLREGFNRLERRYVFTVANSTPFEDEVGKLLERGDLVQLIWAGRDGRINPPRTSADSSNRGQPTGDDRLIGVQHAVGENVSEKGSFRFQTVAWSNQAIGMPANGDLVYVRAFNSNSLETATRYGDARPYQVSMTGTPRYTPLIEGGRTMQPFEGGIARTVLPADFELLPNYPNPFNSSTLISFSVPHFQDSQGGVELAIFNSLGQVVKVLLSGTVPTEVKSVAWDGTDSKGRILSSGVYFARMRAGSLTKTVKMLMIK